MKRLVALGVIVLACAGVTYAGEIDPGLGQVLRESQRDEIVSTLLVLGDRVDAAELTRQLDAHGATLRTGDGDHRRGDRERRP